MAAAANRVTGWEITRAAKTVSQSLAVLVNAVSTAEDRRAHRGERHHVMTILVIAILALLSNANDCEQIAAWGRAHREWLRTFPAGGRKDAIPSQFRAVLAMVDPGEFERLVMLWVKEPRALREDDGRSALQIEGKTLRGTYDRDVRKARVHIVTAWSESPGLVWSQQMNEAKSNEIPTVERTLHALDVKGRCATGDAMMCQRKIVKKIRKRGGNYCIAIAANQPTLLEEAAGAFTAAFDRAPWAGDRFKTVEPRKATEVDEGHGRIDVRRAWVLTDLSLVPCVMDWEGAVAIGLVLRSRTPTDGRPTTSEAALYLLDKATWTRESLIATTRGHWGVENGLHHVLDVALREDAHRVRNRDSAANLSTGRRVAQNDAGKSAAPEGDHGRQAVPMRDVA